MKFLDPAALARLSRLSLRARRVVEGLLAGLHDSPHRGHSLEFAQHREYAAGDELRHLDWKVYGRTDRFFVRQFQDETNLRAYLMLDTSGSMRFSAGGRISKLSYAVHLAASLAYLLLHQEDAVSLGTFDTALRTFLPPRHQLSHLSLIFDRLEHAAPGGDTAVSRVLADLGPHLRRRGLIVLISDLLDDADDVLKAVKCFRYHHHEVIVFHVLDTDEIRFPYSGDTSFAGLERNDELQANADAVAAAYRELFDGFLEQYKTGFRRSGIDYHLVTTDTPFELALNRSLVGRN